MCEVGLGQPTHPMNLSRSITLLAVTQLTAVVAAVLTAAVVWRWHREMFASLPTIPVHQQILLVKNHGWMLLFLPLVWAAVAAWLTHEDSTVGAVMTVLGTGILLELGAVWLIFRSLIWIKHIVGGT
jgi:hypothetical protein